MQATKEGRFFIFTLDDGCTVKYDLATGKTYGKTGKEVKGLNTQLKGKSIDNIIESFEDPNYRVYLQFIKYNFVNGHIKNFGTFLTEVDKHSKYEQFFAAGITNISTWIDYNMKDIPKQLLKLCREYNMYLDIYLIREMKDKLDYCVILMNAKCVSWTPNDRKYIIENAHYNPFFNLITQYNYNIHSLINYIDNLMTYEALGSQEAVRELYDYVRMASQISPKFEKYPKHLLTNHRIMTRNYERLRKIYEEEKFKDRVDESMECTIGRYKFIYPKCTQDIKDEAAQQQHCVASYISNVIDGHCHIMFMRLRDKTDESLVTIEVRDNQVVQKKGHLNRDVTTEEAEAITKFGKYLIRKDQKMINTMTNNEEVMVC